MGCGSKSRPKPDQVVQISVKRSAPRPTIAPTPKPEPAPKPPAWIESRRAMCKGCQYNTDGVCVLYQLQHPERDCIIETGIEIPYAACPAGLWPRVEWTCDCGAVNRNDAGVCRCDACGAIPPRRVSMPYLAKFAPDQPWQPNHPRLICTLPGDTLELTRESMELYAYAHGADFRVIDDASKGYTQANKFRLSQLARQYDRVLVLDPEVWINPNAPDVFSFPDGAAYYRDDASVVLFDGSQSHIWQSPRLPIVDRKNAVMAQLQTNIEAQGVPVGIFDRRWHWRWQTKEDASRAYFVNLANCPKDRRKTEIVRHYA